MALGHRENLMIVKLRIEITDEQRRGLTGKKLTSREQVTQFLEGCIAALTIDSQSKPERKTTHIYDGKPALSKIEQLMDRVLLEDAGALKGKSDSFVRDWAKVKYSKELI